MRIPGFTLSELLIAVIILGVIAAFSVPKVLQGQQDQKRKAVMKEVVATLIATGNTGGLTGELNADDSPINAENYFTDHINHVQKCVPANLCWDYSYTAARFDCYPSLSHPSRYPVLKMHNGALIQLYFTYSGQWQMVQIDWNGPEGPNLHGEDIFALGINAGPDNIPAKPGWYPAMKPGQLEPFIYCTTASDRQAYYDLFKSE